MKGLKRNNHEVLDSLIDLLLCVRDVALIVVQLWKYSGVGILLALVRIGGPKFITFGLLFQNILF